MEVNPTSSSAASTGSQSDALRGLDMEHFLELMIAEMQNQDPLNPMENSEILTQISQIREIEASNQLSDTLESVLMGQNLSTAGGLIGKVVSALDDAGNEVVGSVDRVTVANGQIMIHVGEHRISLENVREIRGAEVEPVSTDTET